MPEENNEEKNEVNTKPKPAVGRIVHMTMQANSHNLYGTLPAIIVQVHEDLKVDLCVFGLYGIGYYHNVEEGDGEGRWKWPERV